MKGATFTVSLPLMPRPGEKRTPPVEDLKTPESVAPLKGLHVLLVDDDQDTLELLSAALTQRKARVTAVSSANEALEAIKLSTPDVLVSDIAMPGEDGYELIRKVRAMSGGHSLIPAVAITAYAKEEDRVRALSSGFQCYLSKPVEPSDLVSAVANAARNN
jgi:CheY-like chemotaxis protein